ncbi:hypothetical protein [Pseudoxanthomonas jiangsuensis]|uniref:hypothetical protein n=1 Tax=Pseudoxanthomonas jiangsuensis TaxID=619688 RepID=UPI001390DFF7|nr:hypothetical protein [Pseudoxanthomonas jiangsuensis]
MADPVAWTFACGGEIVEQLDALTDVLPAENGVEQRRGLRLSPRTTLEFSGLEEGAARRHLEHLLHANGAGRWWVPFPMDRGALPEPLAAGATAVPVDTRWRHYRAGGRALLLGATPRDYELVDVDEVASDALTLAEPTVRDWPAGTAVLPVALARLDGMPSLSRFTSDAVPYQVRFLFEEPVDWPATAGAAEYRDVPVLEVAPDWGDDPAWTPERQFVEEDNGTAPPARFDPQGGPRGLAMRNYTLLSMEQAAAFRSLLYALDGRRCPIWLPSLAGDLQVVANVSNGATTLDVGWTGLSAWPLAQGRRDLRIQLRSGTVLYRRITAATAVGDDVERLTLDAAIGTGFTAAQVALVSFLVPVRQEADAVVLRWWSHGTASAQLSFRGLRDGL